jgi:hypothetical protein
MSRATVEQLIGKLVIDEHFREAVAAEGLAALDGYDLTDEERAAFMRMNLADVGAGAQELDVRISKGKAGESSHREFA